MPCVNMIEFWKDGGALVRDVEAQTFGLLIAFVIANPWNHRTWAFSLDECEF